MSPPPPDRRVAPGTPGVPPSAGAGDPEVPPRPPSEPALGISGAQVAASVLASVSAAVVASFFGVAGTMVGAGVVSVVITVGSAVYGHGIRRTQAKLRAANLTRMTPGRGAVRSSRSTGTLGSRPAGGPPDAEHATPSPDLTSADWRTWLGRRKWRLAGAAALVFALSLATITLVEVAGGRPIAGRTEGGDRTTIGSLFSGPTGDPTPTPTTTPGDPSSPSITEPVEGEEAPADDGTDTESDTESDTGDAETTTTTVAPTTVPAAPAPGSDEQTAPASP